MTVDETLLETFMNHAVQMAVTLHCGCIFTFEKEPQGFHAIDCTVCAYHIEETDGNNFDGPGSPAPAGEWAHMVRCDLNEKWRAH